MSKRPFQIQPTLEKSGFTVKRVARKEEAKSSSASGTVDRVENEAVIEGAVPMEEFEAAREKAKIEFNRRQWSRNYESKWRHDYDWLGFNYKTGRAFCKTCTQNRGKTCWAKEGNTNVKTSAFIEHGGGDVDHGHCCFVTQMGHKPMDKIVKKATVKCDESMVILLRAAYFTAKESLAFSTFPNLTHLLSICTSDLPRRLYRDDKSCIEFIYYMSQVIQVVVLDRVKTSPFWGLMIDESTDVSVTSHLVVFCSILEEGQIKTAFLGLLHIPHKDSSSIVQELWKYIEEWGLEPSRLVGFGSDGALTMLGSKNGVAVRLRRSRNPFLTITHCVAHRTNLASLAAAKFPTCKVVSEEVDAILNSVSSYFAHLSKRKAGLYSLQETLSDVRKSMKRFCKIRWLSRSESVCTLCDSLESVLVYFKDIAGKDDCTAKSLFQKLASMRMIYILYFLADILSGLTKLSKVFQKSVVDVSSVGSLVNTTCTEVQVNFLMDNIDLNAQDHDNSGFALLPDYGPPGGYLKRLQSEIRTGKYFHSVEVSRDTDGGDLEAAVNFQKNFAAALISCLHDRFQDNNIIACFKIFNPREVPSTPMGMRDLGSDELDQLLLFYGESRELENGRTVPAIVSPTSIKGRPAPDSDRPAEVAEPEGGSDL
ncbi:hypothetical protein R1sor_020557 [Riccia sorocarpa]|uniref:Uncharacterized protein n=1 Tax=Riccia sorocarpa TaxID=122646 RepID=A0ABD3IJD8_9MARC